MVSNCVPGAPFIALGVPLDSGQQEQPEYVAWGQMNTGQGHQGEGGPNRTLGI
jgi:hypothetical protein